MASETIKALMMITLFCSLQAALHLPRMINSQTIRRWRQMTLLPRLHWPVHPPAGYALIPVQVRRRRHGGRRHSGAREA
ncbi:MAG TPA: hypothetical protein VKY22_11605 [Bradyrhizobium sp.]|nr:hypothetical protein [Bradyrhizobium sp.]